MAKNLAKFVGFRLYQEQIAKVAKVAAKLKISESEVIRRMIEKYEA